MKNDQVYKVWPDKKGVSIVLEAYHDDGTDKIMYSLTIEDVIALNQAIQNAK